MAEATTAAAATAAGDTAAATTAATATTTTAAAVDDNRLALGEGGDTTADTTTEPSWRERYAGDDKQALKRMERFASEADFFKSFRETENKLRSGRQAPAELAEGAGEEEVAAYRKALGVPDKPEGYGFKFADEIGATEADNAVLGEFQAHMHDRHVPPAYAKAAFEFYAGRMAEDRIARTEAAKEATLESIGELKSEWKGRDYARNLNLAQEFLLAQGAFSHLEPFFEPEAMQQILKIPMPNGVELRNHPPFVKGLVKLARAMADEEAVYSGDGAPGGKSMSAEYDDLIKKSVTPGQKLSDSEFARMQELAGAKNRSEERSSRRAA